MSRVIKKVLKIAKKEEKWLKVLKVRYFEGDTYDFLWGVSFGEVEVNFGDFGRF